MKVIYKWTLDGEHTVLNLPKGAKPIAVHPQHDQLCVWAEVDTEEEDTEKFEFFVFGTGQPVMKFPGQYLGTCLVAGDSLVWHVYYGKL